MVQKNFFVKFEPARLILYSFFLLLVFSVSAFFMLYRLTIADIEGHQTAVVSNETALNQSKAAVLTQWIHRLTSDLLYIRSTVRMTGLAEAGKSQLKRLWCDFADSTKFFDQIRYLDRDGNELIRINYSDSGSYVVPTHELQNKADRYYFTDSIGLKPRQIFISRLDLNIEHDAIEKPDKPMIRLAIPYTDEQGVTQGEIVLNFLADRMLKSLAEVSKSSLGRTYLLNSNGYWLYNDGDRSTEWAFMYKDRKGTNFTTLWPEEWKKICKVAKGIFSTKDGLFAFSRIMTSSSYEINDSGYSLVLDEGDWIIVSHVPADSSYGKLFTMTNRDIAWNAFKKVLPTFFWVWIPIGILTFFLDRLYRKRARIRYLAEYDEMTKTFNRRTGLERLRELCTAGVKNAPMTICFLDVNGLKVVNDTLGHAAGDELILGVVDVIKSNVREQDFLARLGGDEFLIVSCKTSAAGMEALWQRICKNLEEINATGKFPYRLSVSHGIAVYEPGDDENSITQRADRAMYEEKRALKNQPQTDPAS